MLGSTEKVIHTVGKTTLALLALLLCVCVGWSVYQIKTLGERRINLIDLSDQVDEARDANQPVELIPENYLEAVKRDWEPQARDKQSKPTPLRQWVFYPRP